MKTFNFVAAVLYALVSSTRANAQMVCNVLPGMVSLDVQDNECCGAAIILVSAGAIQCGMGGMLGGSCLHMGNYAEYFPDGCTDCTQPGDEFNIPGCTAGSSPTLTSMAAAQEVLCCKEVDGGLCHTSIVAGAATGAGAMNGQIVSGLDQDYDGNVDVCEAVVCDAPTQTVDGDGNEGGEKTCGDCAADFEGCVLPDMCIEGYDNALECEIEDGGVWIAKGEQNLVCTDALPAGMQGWCFFGSGCQPYEPDEFSRQDCENDGGEQCGPEAPTDAPTEAPTDTPTDTPTEAPQLPSLSPEALDTLSAGSVVAPSLFMAAVAFFAQLM